MTKNLSSLGLTVEAVTNKGYRIPGGVCLLQKDTILSYLESQHTSLLKSIEIFDSLPSTNDYLLQTLPTKPKNNVACFAEHQTAGKGRNGRTWISPFAKNIYLSVRWQFPQDPSALSGLSLVIAVSLIDTLRTFGIRSPLGIKWPNDVLSDKQKLAGILVEVGGEANNHCYAVIGIGLNVDMPNTHHNDIGKAWTDLQTLYGAPIDRNQIAGLLLNNLTKDLLIYQTQGFGAFVEKWQQLDLTRNQSVQIVTSTLTFKGIGRGIQTNGQFLLENESGTIQAFSSGEVSLRLLG